MRVRIGGWWHTFLLGVGYFGLGAPLAVAMSLLTGAVVAAVAAGLLALLALAIGGSVSTGAMSGVYVGCAVAVVNFVWDAGKLMVKFGELRQREALKALEGP